MNYILLIFSLLTSNVIIFGSLINVFENKLPVFFLKIFKYGKFAYRGEIPKIYSKLILDVPKSWFRHFYLFASVFYSYVFFLVTCAYVSERDIPHWFNTLLNLLCGEDRIAYTSATKTYLALTLMTSQVFRRLYDTHFISIYGKNSKMNIAPYLAGLYHYPACIFAILSGAPKFSAYSTSSAALSVADISYLDVFSIFLFIWAWWHQHTTTKILADLRKNKKGDVVSDDYKLPHGDWFKYLSAPHQNAEILMYLSLTLLLWKNITWLFVFFWVLCNQVETILLSHWWYQETFDKFPRNRKALIPFIY